MKKTFILIFIGTCIFAACSSTRKSARDSDFSRLSGNWELSFISGQSIAFEVLYPVKKPYMRFDQTNKIVSGNTSCNNFNGSFKLEGNKISFPEPLTMTKMACLDGNGETVFLETLNKITNFSLDKNRNTLHLNAEDIELMKLTKK